MTKKTKITIISILAIILIVAGYFIFFTSKNDRLTVTDIHDNIVYGKTTKKDLENRYGKPDEIVSNSEKANDVFNHWNGDAGEGGVDDMLEDHTDYFDTEKVDQSSMKKYFKSMKGTGFDSYIEYEGKNLGVNHVRFFFWRGTVYGIQFGNKITNESAAKRDKYLKQIYGD